MGPIADNIIVTGGHVEIGSGKVTLVLVIRLKNAATVTAVGAGTQASFGNISVIAQSGAALTHAIRIV